MSKTSPLTVVAHERFCIEVVPDSCGMVIFGASGDLTHRKLIPALFELERSRLLPKGFFIVGFARSAGTDETFRAEVAETLKAKSGNNKTAEGEFLRKFYYHQGDYIDTSSLAALRGRLQELNVRHACKGNVLFYLAVPPPVYCLLIHHLSAAGLIQQVKPDLPWTRVVIEKPFGEDLVSAKALNAEIHEELDESQIYRIDHYLGKETVQNILIFRFANSIFEPIWNHQNIDHVQITAAETLGVEHRAGYYDKAGALRDMFQNHMFELLTMVAMEPPIRFDADRYRDEKVRLLRSLRPLPLNRLEQSVVRGQYQGYREEVGVAARSSTETFAALKLFIDNWRWEGVPFYLRSGKRLARQMTEIMIQFKNIPHSIFAPIGADQFPANRLIFRIHPDEGITLSFEAKQPGGPKICMATLELEFSYRGVFGIEMPEAYNRLLLDCMQGDQTLFVRQDTVETAWSYITPVLQAWNKQKDSELASYPQGSWGPPEAAALIERDGRSWREE